MRIRTAFNCLSRSIVSVTVACVVAAPAFAADTANQPAAPVHAPGMTIVAGTAPLTVTSAGTFSVSAMIDGKGPYSLMIDSGAEIMVLKSSVAKAAGLSVDAGKVEVKGTTGGFVPVGQADVDTVQIAGITLHHPVCVVESMNFPCDGLIGAPLLNAGVVQLDFAGKQITTYAPDTFVANAGDVGMPIVFGKHRLPVVAATIAGADAKLEVDSGSAFPAELMPDFIKAHDLTTKFTKVGSVGRVSISGPAQSDIYGMDSLILGDKPAVRIPGPIPTLFIEPAQAPVASDFDGRVGCPMLAGTSVTFDYPHAMLYLRPTAVPPATTTPAPNPSPTVPPATVPAAPPARRDSAGGCGNCWSVAAAALRANTGNIQIVAIGKIPQEYRLCAPNHISVSVQIIILRSSRRERSWAITSRRDQTSLHSASGPSGIRGGTRSARLSGRR